MSIFKNNSINNPFEAPNTGNPDFFGLFEAYLPEGDVKKVKSVLGKEDEQDPSNPNITDIPANGLEGAMSDEEIEKLKIAEEERLDPLKRIIAWAKKYYLGDEDWVKENFEFNDDGSVICNTDLDLDFITELDFPEIIKYVRGYIYLNSLISAKGLKLPDKIEGNLFLKSLTSAEGLKLPDKIEGDLFLKSLTSAEGLNLPDKIYNLFLSGLTSAEGLKLPKEIRGSLFLNRLTSTKSLDLTDIEVRGYIYLDKVPEDEKQKLSEKYPNLLIF